MNEAWNLDPIYKDFDDPAFSADLSALQKAVEDYEALSAALTDGEPLATVRRGIELEEQCDMLAGKLLLYSSLRQSADTRNPACTSQIGRIMNLYSRTAAPRAAFQSWCAKQADLLELADSDDFLKDYHYLLANIQADSRYLMSNQAEAVAAKMAMSGGNAWGDLQQYLTSTVPVTFRGEKTNLSTIRNMAYDPDPAVRKEAYEAELACYDRIRDAVAFAMNSIKLETLSLCQLRGYESPLARTLSRSRMKRQTLDAMFSAIDDYLPKFWQYLRTKAKALGHTNGLKWYDLFAPMGSSEQKFTAEEARDYLVDIFTRFNPEEGEMIRRAFDEAWIDFYPRDGKTGGAFCAGVPCLGESRILTNFDGRFSDVITLAHELGHAYHDYCIRDHRILNRDYSMPVAETASTFNECVTMADAIAQAKTKQERLLLIESQLQDVTQVICDIYSRYRFESRVFAERADQFLDADTLCAYMLEAQKQSYGDGLDHTCLHPYMWLCKSHYYGSSFYNFPYAFGALFARGLYACYEREGAAFLPKYRKLLHTTPVATVEDSAAVAGIDLTDKAFWAQALEVIAQQIDLFCAQVEE